MLKFAMSLDLAITEGPDGPGRVVPMWLADNLTSWAWHVQAWDEEDGTVLLHVTEAGLDEGVSTEEAAAQWAAWAETQSGGGDIWRPLVAVAAVPCPPHRAVVKALRGLAESGKPGLALATARALVGAGLVLPDTVRDAGMFPDWPS